MNYLYLFIGLFLISSYNAQGRIRDFETTRLMSTAGAGVASILVNEAAFLNPAPIVFVPSSAFYYQRGKVSHRSDSANRISNFSDGTQEAYLISDSSSNLKGTFSYQRQAENQFKRQRYTSSFASNYGKKTAVGILYRYTIDEDIRANNEKKFHQGTLGITHVFSEKLTFGAILVDPFLSNRGDSRIVTGIQYTIAGSLLLILDYGFDYNDEPKKNNFVKGALQVNFFKDLFLRVGKYEDHISGLGGNSWGLSWIGPRISLEYSVKTSEVMNQKSSYLFEDENLTESSLSFAVLF